jgi:hypothetical protein
MSRCNRFISMRSFRRFAGIGSLAVVLSLASGAKCIERTSVYVDKDGYTHIVGEMVNETQVQGTGMMLMGTLYDANGGVIAQKIVPTCPPDTQANSQIVFDVRFDNPSVPPHAGYDVRPVSGIALGQPLPNPDTLVLRTYAARYKDLPPFPGFEDFEDDVFIFFEVRNRSGQTLGHIQGCSAVYDQQGNVIHVFSGELIMLDENDSIVPALMEASDTPGVVTLVAENVPTGPVQVKTWLWFGEKDAPGSQWQFVQSPFITIQTISP